MRAVRVAGLSFVVIYALQSLSDLDSEYGVESRAISDGFLSFFCRFLGIGTSKAVDYGGVGLMELECVLRYVWRGS